MQTIKLKLLFLLCLTSAYSLQAETQNKSYEYITNPNQPSLNEVKFYERFFHQHQDFFNKAFSYQGLEARFNLNGKVIIGGFAGMFITPLSIEIDEKANFANAFKTGLTVGQFYHAEKIVHTGWTVNAGYSQIQTDETSFNTFDVPETASTYKSMLLSPELFTEAYITPWMKFKTGISFPFYNFEDQSVVQKDDLQSLSVNVGFTFGHFQ